MGEAPTARSGKGGTDTWAPSAASLSGFFPAHSVACRCPCVGLWPYSRSGRRQSGSDLYREGSPPFRGKSDEQDRAPTHTPQYCVSTSVEPSKHSRHQETRDQSSLTLNTHGLMCSTPCISEKYLDLGLHWQPVLFHHSHHLGTLTSTAAFTENISFIYIYVGGCVCHTCVC